MKQKFPKVINGLIAFTLLLFVIFTIANSFPLESYVPVHKKWSIYRKVLPPDDYDQKVLRDIDIDLLAPIETAKDGDFYWLQTSGDLITLTNRNFRPVKGTLSFNLDIDPCGTKRDVFIGTQDGSLAVETAKSKQTKVNFEFKIDSNSSEFFSIVGSPIKPCKINEEMNRSFMTKLTEIKVINLQAND
jgi:hypothetical protein